MSFYKKSYRDILRLSLKNFKKYEYNEYLKYKNDILKSSKIYYDNKSTDTIYEWNVNNEIANTYGQENVWLSVPYTFKFMVKKCPKSINDEEHTIQALNMIKLYDNKLGDKIIKKKNPCIILNKL